MFRKHTGDLKKSASKVLDQKKDNITRLKHLKVVLDNFEHCEAKAFFERNYSQIYYIFFDVFIGVEADLKQRANRSHREELESVLYIFEKILILLPELIHKRWQYHSIGRLMKKLLHSGNSYKLRCEGMRLFILWYQILMENATEDCHRSFAGLVPGLNVAEKEHQDLDLFTVANPSVEMQGRVYAVEMTCMLSPQAAGEKPPPNIPALFLTWLLNFIVTVNSVHWTDKYMQEASFSFLFERFKEHYLKVLFPELKATSIYEPCLDPPENRSKEEYNKQLRNGSLISCQDTVVKWLATFVRIPTKPQKDPSSGHKTHENHLAGQMSIDGPPVHLTMSKQHQAEPGHFNDPGGVPTESGALTASNNSSTLSGGSLLTEQGSGASGGDDHHGKPPGFDVVQKVLFGSRDNVNIIHEIFRQAFLFPYGSYSSGMRTVIKVYKEWLLVENRPLFMQEPDDGALVAQKSSSNCVGGTNIPSQDSTDSECSTPKVHLSPASSARAKVMTSSSFDSAGGSDLNQVKAGMQLVMQVFITNAANVFLLDDLCDEDMEEQFDMCKRVLNMYRLMVDSLQMNLRTWEQLLQVLLKITSGVLSEEPPDDKTRTRGGRLAAPLFQTLIVTWIKANLHVYISASLWDQYHAVLSSLTEWIELIKEWGKTMDTLTRVKAKQVYHLDMDDLPLKRLTEQKQTRKRGANKQGVPRNVASLRAMNYDSSMPKDQSKSRTNPYNLSPIPSYSPVAAAGDESHHRQFVASNAPPGGTQEPEFSSLVRSSSDSNLVVDSERKAMNPTITVNAKPLLTDGASKGESSSLAEEVLVQMVGGENAESGSNRGLSTASNSDSVSLTSMDSSGQNMPYSIIDQQCSGATQDSPRGYSPGNREVSKSSSSRSSTPSMSSRHDSCNLSIDSSALNEDTDEGEDFDEDEEMVKGGTLRRERKITESSTDTSFYADRDIGGVMQMKHSDRAHTNSPTPDRDSIHIDDMEVNSQSNGHSSLMTDDNSSCNDNKSVITGGQLSGWTPDVTVILWRRMLGALGNINAIDHPAMHSLVYTHLTKLVSQLFELRDNMSIAKDNAGSPPAPELLPPTNVIVPWLFEATLLNADYQRGKIQAYQLLCQLTMRRQDVPLSNVYLSRFYYILHNGLVHSDQETINAIITYCSPGFFSRPLPGNTMLLLDFVHAANSITSAPDLSHAPRLKAVSLLGSLLCIPNHIGTVPVLQPNAAEISTMQCADFKDHIVDMLLKSGKKEPNGLARCVSLCSLGIFLYEELSHNTRNPKIKEAINILLLTLTFKNKAVAQVATDMLLLLCDKVDVLLERERDMVEKIIEEITKVIGALLPLMENSKSDDHRKLLISIMKCLLDWCIRVPVNMLLETSGGHKCLLYKTFRVLNLAITGTQGLLTPRGSVNLSEMLSPDENDLENLREIPLPRGSAGERSNIHEQKQNGTESPKKEEDNKVKLAARMVMTHLVNHLGHFPMSGDAACMNSVIQEFHDVPSLKNLEELKPEILQSPNVQFCLINRKTLLSFVEIPAPNVPGGGVTAGLTTGKTVTRVILRDVAGKYSWDSAVLYGPPKCRAGSYPAASQPSLKIVKDLDEVGVAEGTPEVSLAHPIEDDSHLQIDSPSRSRCSSPHKRTPSEISVPKFDVARGNANTLTDMLSYVGMTSPECLLHPPRTLTDPSQPPSELITNTMAVTTKNLELQKQAELNYLTQHGDEDSMVARPLKPMENRDPISPFQLCRLFLNQMGFLNWEKRTQIDLLKKSDKLLRELKHLDNQLCRDSHKVAVLYVAEGQEDKLSILTNPGGSTAFEEFVAGLGWEVDLESHMGFLGGLQRNKTTGATAPYYATSVLEVVFHVSTRMPAETDEDRHRKLRHLGNDEVQIIWSEHTRDYRRGIIPTEFGDVMIIIYPMANGLFRIAINQKPEVGFFGPLFDGAIVNAQILPGLVRATAINAGCCIRRQKQYFQTFYEERAQSLKMIADRHCQKTTFEDFSAQLFAPILPQGDLIGANGNTEMPSLPSMLYNNHSEYKDIPELSSQTVSKSSNKDATDSTSSGFSRRLSFGKSKKSTK